MEIKCYECRKNFSLPDPWDSFCTKCGSWVRLGSIDELPISGCIVPLRVDATKDRLAEQLKNAVKE